MQVDTWPGDFKRREVRVVPGDVKEDWFVICWSACWMFQETFGASVTPKEARARDDKRILKQLLNLLKVADFVVTYNGNRFDIPKIMWRLMYHHLLPVPHFASIDVMAHLKGVSLPTSLSLDFIAKQLGYGGKVENPPDLWPDAEAGKKAALDHMLIYNNGDVDKTHDVYLHTRPYWKNHPNFAQFLDIYRPIDETLDVGKDNHRCPRCLNGVISKHKFSKKRQTPAGYFYKVANCPNCGAIVYQVQREIEINKLRHRVCVR